MPRSQILFDLTEFMRYPLRTGIQRVVYEIIRNWSGRMPLCPAQVGKDGRLEILPETIFPAMAEYFAAKNTTRPAARVRKLGKRPVARLRVEEVCDYPALLNAELFAEPPQRYTFYQRLLELMNDRIFFLVYDYLPWLHPEVFSPGVWQALDGHFKLTRQLVNLSFISEATRQDYLQRIVRRPHGAAGPALPLGADSLGTADPVTGDRGNTFAVIGTLEPRKNHKIILDAFAALWRKGVDIRLTLVGRMGWMDEATRGRIDHLNQTEPRFKWLLSLADEEVARVVRSSRATIYISQLEGFGLPPLESLSLGIPTIVAADLPSVNMIADLGQVRLQPVTSATLEEAVLSLLDPDTFRQKQEEIRGLRLPRWSDLGSAMARWVEDTLAAKVMPHDTHRAVALAG